MKALDLITLCILGFVLLCGCNEVSIDQEYVDENFGFAFDPPTGWTESHELSSKAVLFFPEDSSMTNFTVSAPMILSEGLALSVYADGVEEQYPELFDDFKTISRDWRDHPSHTAYEIIYSYTDDGEERVDKLVAIKHQRTVFLLNFFALKESYDYYIDEVDASIDSFKII